MRSGSWVSAGRPTVRSEMGPLQLEVILVLDSAIACAAGRTLLHICLGCGWGFVSGHALEYFWDRGGWDGPEFLAAESKHL